MPQDGPGRRAVYFRNVYLLNAKALGKMCNPMDYHILPHALPQHYITLPLPARTVAYACVRYYKPQDTTRKCQAITYHVQRITQGTTRVHDGSETHHEWFENCAARGETAPRPTPATDNQRRKARLGARGALFRTPRTHSLSHSVHSLSRRCSHSQPHHLVALQLGSQRRADGGEGTAAVGHGFARGWPCRRERQQAQERC